MNLNNKGFTLVELLGVVVILATITAIMVPSVNHLIDRNKEDNYNSLKNGIVRAAKIYVSDNRYNITLSYGNKLCDSGEFEESVSKIAGNTLTDNKLPIKLLVDAKVLTTNSDGKIINPKGKDKKLNLNNSYVLIKYQCSSKSYTYTLEEGYLFWE